MTDEQADRLRRETEAVSAKIDAAYAKLAAKLRGKADKAKAAMDAKKSETKRAVLRRRFELYADAAHDIETRLAERHGSQDPVGD